MTIAAGTTLTITMGCYSDYRFVGPFRVLKDINTDEITARIKEDCGSEDYDASTSDVTPWLVKNGFIEDLTGTFEWHVGDYSLGD